MTAAQYDLLLIEDDDGDATLVKHRLKQSSSKFRVQWVSTLAEAIESLPTKRVDVILTDLSLPDSDGRNTVSKLRRQCPDTAIVVLTGCHDNDLAMELLEIGANDYVVKCDGVSEDLERTLRCAIQRQDNLVQIRELLTNLQAQRELLERKNQKLERLYRQAHDFVDNVSHEFRTPLTVIKEYVSLIRDGVVSDPSEQMRLLHVVEDRADDLNIMVDDMLDVSKLEAGMLGAWRRSCTVADVLDHIRLPIERKAEVKRILMDWNIDEDLPEIYCDPEKIGRVIINLAMNAVKFCGNPGVVGIGAKLDANHRQIVFAVSDNGHGIDPQAQESIFQRFTQLSNQSKGTSKGFGLGLNIAKELVALNFGRISVQSQPGNGTTFSFTVPLAVPEEIIRRYVNSLPTCDDAPSRYQPWWRASIQHRAMAAPRERMPY